MKVQARVEKELFRAVNKTKKLKLGYSSSDILEKLENAERKKVLTWILSDLDRDLDDTR